MLLAAPAAPAAAATSFSSPRSPVSPGQIPPSLSKSSSGSNFDSFVFVESAAPVQISAFSGGVSGAGGSTHGNDVANGGRAFDHSAVS